MTTSLLQRHCCNISKRTGPFPRTARLSFTQVSRVELLDEVMMHAFNLANSYSYTEQPTLMFELVGASKVMVGAFYSRSGTLPVLLSPPLAPIPTVWVPHHHSRQDVCLSPLVRGSPVEGFLVPCVHILQWAS